MASSKSTSPAAIVPVVLQEFARRGCELLDTYLNARTRMRYRCSCGRIAYTTWDHFRSGSDCRECGNRKSAEKQRAHVDLDHAVRLLRTGMTQTEVAAHFHTGRVTLNKLLSQAGITHFEVKHGQKPSQLTDVQRQVFHGNMLGDGTIRTRGVFCFKQKYAARGYVETVHAIMQPLVGPIAECVSVANDRPFRQCYFVSPRLPLFVQERARWYPRNVKILPADLQLTPLTIAVWFCDDGSNHQQGKRIRLSTESFTPDEVDRLVGELAGFGIASRRKESRSGPIIRVHGGSYDAFLALVSPHILADCMRYKIDTSRVRRWHRKVTADTEEAIRTLCLRDGLKQGEVARRLGIHCSTVSRVVHGIYGGSARKPG